MPDCARASNRDAARLPVTFNACRCADAEVVVACVAGRALAAPPTRARVDTTDAVATAVTSTRTLSLNVIIASALSTLSAARA